MTRPALRGALLASVLLLAVRLYAAGELGFGDSEALYASYALYPQPVYLDHPGLIGLLARLIGGGGAPSPSAAHAGDRAPRHPGAVGGALAARAAGASGPAPGSLRSRSCSSQSVWGFLASPPICS